MSLAIGSLPRELRDDSMDEEIARLSRPDGDSEARPFNGKSVAPSAVAKRGRIERGEDARPHVIRSIRFGLGRLTTCATCDYTCTGTSDRVMELAWNAHPPSMRLAHAERVARSRK